MSARAPKPPVTPVQSGILAANPANPADRVPAVPDTVPLASDQTSAPAVAVGAVVDPVDDIVPAVLSGASTAPAPTGVKPPLVKVDGSVPLPSDQMTPRVPAVSTEPGAPAAMPSVVPPRASALVMESDREAIRAEIRREAFDTIVSNVSDEGRRTFIVVAEVHHDGKVVAPGRPVVLTFDQHERLFQGLSVLTPWYDGKDVV